MGLTNHLPSSRIAQAGVVADTASRPASPYEGQLIYQLDTNQLLVWNGSAWVAPNSTTANPPGLELIKTGSFSAATEILLDSEFTSSYQNYRFLLDCQSSAGANIFTWQLRSSGSTIGGTSYQWQANNITNTSNTSARTTGQSYIRIGANDTGAYHSLHMDIFCPALAQPTRTISCFNRDTGYQVENVWGGNTNSTAYDGMRVAVLSGNMTGTYSLYGYRN